MTPEPPIVLLDTNVVLDWIVFRDPSVATLTEAVETGAVRWLACEQAIAELEHVLTREPLVGLTVDRSLVDRFSTRVPTVETPPVPKLRCTDPDDQKFLDLALRAGARWLVSRDKALLKLARKARPLGLAIVTPDRWSL